MTNVRFGRYTVNLTVPAQLLGWPVIHQQLVANTEDF
jgi:hypothetical protein